MGKAESGAVLMFTSVATVVVVAAIITAAGVYYAWAGVILWGWFAVEQFGAPEVSVPQMWGLMLVMQLTMPTGVSVSLLKDEVKVSAVSRLANLALTPLLLLAVGYCLHTWMQP